MAKSTYGSLVEKMDMPGGVGGRAPYLENYRLSKPREFEGEYRKTDDTQRGTIQSLISQDQKRNSDYERTKYAKGGMVKRRTR